MVKRPTGSGGEPSSPNCGASAGVEVRHLLTVYLTNYPVFGNRTADLVDQQTLHIPLYRLRA